MENTFFSDIDTNCHREDGFFMEVHDNPPEGLSDSTNMLYLSSLEGLLKDLIAINDVVKKDKEMGLVAGK